MTQLAVKKLKTELRQKHRALRRELSPGERHGLDAAIQKEILQHLLSIKVSNLSAFWPNDGEPDLRPALHKLAAEGISIALPVIRPDSSVMHFHNWQESSSMTENHFGIPEPVDEPIVQPETLSSMLIPLVAWDRKGGRLGMGAGYYDRVLAPLEHNDSPLRIGIAYGIQEVNNVPISSHDIPLHGVICEHGWIAFNQ
jgi:5-formyltetrahydrofolate cyclo-ligase